SALGAAALVLAALAGCATKPSEGEPAKPVATAPVPPERPDAEAPGETKRTRSPEPVTRPGETAPAPEAERAQTTDADSKADGARFVAARFADLPGWTADYQAAALAAFLRGCETLANRAPWRAVCNAARKVPPSNPAAARRFFETHFR